MAKHLNWEIKYKYVIRYRQGESPLKLGKEISPDAKNPCQNIWNWNKKYMKEGVEGL